MGHRRLAVFAVALLLVLSSPAFAAKGFDKTLSDEARAGFERAHRALAEGNRSAAEQELAKLVELAPDHAPAYNLYFYVMRERPTGVAEGAEKFRTLTKTNPERAAYWFALGRFSQDLAERS